METITAYKANDGKLFETEQEAKEHDKRETFFYWYRHNNYIGGNDNQNMWEWLSHNKRILLSLFYPTLFSNLPKIYEED